MMVLAVLDAKTEKENDIARRRWANKAAWANLDRETKQVALKYQSLLR